MKKMISKKKFLNSLINFEMRHLNDENRFDKYSEFFDEQFPKTRDYFKSGEWKVQNFLKKIHL